MTQFKAILQNRNGIFLLAMAAGLILPAGAPLMKHLVLPVLALAMALSTMEVGNEMFLKPRALFFPAMMGIVMNYLILGNVIIGLAALLIHNEALWTGFVLLAAAPPAVAVIPFSGFLRGNPTLSLIGTVGAYMGALIIMPLISVTLLTATAFDPFKLILLTLELIVLPLAVSRLLIRKGWKERIDPHRGTVVNWSFFVVLYTMIGLNSDILLGQTWSLIPVVFISVISMFLLGFLIEWVSGLFHHLPKESRTSLVLMGTLKNQGLASGLALTLFGREEAIPSVVATMVMIVYVIWLDFRKSRA